MMRYITVVDFAFKHKFIEDHDKRLKYLRQIVDFYHVSEKRLNMKIQLKLIDMVTTYQELDLKSVLTQDEYEPEVRELGEEIAYDLVEGVIASTNLVSSHLGRLVEDLQLFQKIKVLKHDQRKECL